MEYKTCARTSQCVCLLSRGLGPFTSERDDSSRPLIYPQFGHCSQEGLNLLLIGQALHPSLCTGHTTRRTPHTVTVPLLRRCCAVTASFLWRSCPVIVP